MAPVAEWGRDEPSGIVHIGFGAFHRAHQAVYTQDAVELSGDDRWAITAVAPSSMESIDALRRQDGRYSVTARDGHRTDTRMIGVHCRALHLRTERDSVVAALANVDTHVVTLTVTEKAYHLEPQGVVELLALGLRDRLSHGQPLAIVSCDNLRQNGSAVRELVVQSADRIGDTDLSEFVRTSVSFPNTMVDRIVPAATAADLAEVTRLLGHPDELATLTEPFRQWVIQPHFAGPRPLWERAGATLDEDVESYENIKLALLNGTHSALAYLGLLAGHATIAESIADPGLRRVAEQLMQTELAPSVDAPEGVATMDYAASVLTRFANPTLQHTTRQVATDGSQKLPNRLVEVLRRRHASGLDSPLIALVLAAWVAVILTPSLEVADPLAATVRSRANGRWVVPAVPEVWGAELDEDSEFRKSLADQFASLARFEPHKKER